MSGFSRRQRDASGDLGPATYACQAIYRALWGYIGKQNRRTRAQQFATDATEDLVADRRRDPLDVNAEHRLSQLDERERIIIEETIINDRTAASVGREPGIICSGRSRSRRGRWSGWQGHFRPDTFDTH